MTLLAAIAAESGSAFADFDEVATFTPAGGVARGLAGVFDRISEVTDIGAYIEADGVSARFDAATRDIPAVALGDSLAVRGFDYRVVGIEPDGTGRTVLVLGL